MMDKNKERIWREIVEKRDKEIQRLLVNFFLQLRAALDECYSLSSQGDGEELLELIYEISKQALEQECEPESLQQEAR
jgi:hypothetical protein